MSSLAALFSQPPSSFHSWKQTVSHLNLSSAATKYLWNGLSEETRAVYESAKRSYEFYCSYFTIPPWPAQEHVLAEWASARADGSSQIRFQGKVKPKTILSMISALRSVYVYRRLSTKPFESEWLKRILAGISRCHSSDNTKEAEPISLTTLEKVVNTGDKTIEELNFNSACKIAFAGFLRSGEFCYSASDLKDNHTFINTKLTRSDITFTTDDSYAVLHLKWSKSDTEHHGVDIILAATNGPCCPVTALKNLFKYDPQPPSAPLFRLQGPCDYNSFISMLRNRLQALNVPNWQNYSGHSFCRGAAQHASDNGMLGYDIQRLGRWSSDAFKLYFEESFLNRYILNRQFLTGAVPPVFNLAPPSS